MTQQPPAGANAGVPTSRWAWPRNTTPIQARPMAEARHVSVDRVPTLTEVLDLAHGVVLVNVLIDAQPLQLVDQPTAASHVLSSEVLFELEQRIDSLFESRLRNALAPALARAADGVIREARQELSGLLRDLVEDAVTQALERRTRL